MNTGGEFYIVPTHFEPCMCGLPLHRIVIDALKKVDEGRKCFRMIGGVLVERTVKEILPALQLNSEQVYSMHLGGHAHVCVCNHAPTCT